MTESSATLINLSRQQEKLESSVKDLQYTLTLQFESLRNKMLQLESSSALRLEGFVETPAEKATVPETRFHTERAVLALRGVEQRLESSEAAAANYQVIADSALKAAEKRLDRLEKTLEHLVHGAGSSFAQRAPAVRLDDSISNAFKRTPVTHLDEPTSSSFSVNESPPEAEPNTHPKHEKRSGVADSFVRAETSDCGASVNSDATGCAEPKLIGKLADTRKSQDTTSLVPELELGVTSPDTVTRISPQTSFEPAQQSVDSRECDEQLEEKVAQMVENMQSLQERVAQCEEKLLSAGTDAEAFYAMKDSEHASAEGALIKIVKGSFVPGGTPTPAGAEKGNSKTEVESDVDWTELEQSMWDTCILIGLPDTGILGSIYIATLLCLNGFVQITLCFMINDSFTVPEITSEQVIGMRQWRVSFAHSTELMNQFTYQSFALSVCNSEPGLVMVTEAAQLLHAISTYLPTQADYERSQPIVGPVLPHLQWIGLYMSLIAVMIWTMSIATGIRMIKHKHWALKHIPLGTKSEIVYSSGSCTLTSITIARRTCCMLVLLIELLVVILLGFAGTFYIIRTISMRDLLLNCTALALVFNVDELFFEALVPHKAQHLVASMEALPRPPSHNILGMSLSAVFSIILMIVVLACSMSALQQQAATLEDARHEICGGNLNFVARQDSAGVISATYVPPVEELENTYVFEAMRQLVIDERAVHGWFSKEDMSAATSGVIGNPWSLMEWTSGGLNGALDHWNSKCLDMIPVSDGVDPGASHLLHILHDVVEDRSIQDCLQAKQYCNLPNLQGMRTRGICPVTCGCSHPGSYLVLSGMNGCPPACYKTDLYNSSMWSRECKDLTLDSPYWSQLGEGLKTFVSGYSGWDDEGIQDKIPANGCGLLSMQFSVFGADWTDPCEMHSSSLKPLTYACPVSCRCNEHSRYLCPKTCGPLA